MSLKNLLLPLETLACAAYGSSISAAYRIDLERQHAMQKSLLKWDTAGQERFRSITSSYYRIAGGIIIVYDVTNSASFAQIKVQISEMENYCDETIPKILVGNKDDNNNEINKVISTRNVCEYAEENHLTFYETSVKDNKNITEVFNEIARLALERYLGNSLNKVSGILIEQSQTIENVTNKKCCTA